MQYSSHIRVLHRRDRVSHLPSGTFSVRSCLSVACIWQAVGEDHAVFMGTGVVDAPLELCMELLMDTGKKALYDSMFDHACKIGEGRTPSQLLRAVTHSARQKMMHKYSTTISDARV